MPATGNLVTSELHLLADISQDFETTGTSSMDPARIQLRHPYDGLGIQMDWEQCY